MNCSAHQIRRTLRPGGRIIFWVVNRPMKDYTGSQILYLEDGVSYFGLTFWIPRIHPKVRRCVGPKRATALPELKREETDGGSVQIPLPRLVRNSKSRQRLREPLLAGFELLHGRFTLSRLYAAQGSRPRREAARAFSPKQTRLLGMPVRPGPCRCAAKTSSPRACPARPSPKASMPWPGVRGSFWSW